MISTAVLAPPQELPHGPPVRRPRPRVRGPRREELQKPFDGGRPGVDDQLRQHDGRGLSPARDWRPGVLPGPGPRSFGHLSPAADSPVDERLEPLVVVHERMASEYSRPTASFAPLNRTAIRSRETDTPRPNSAAPR